MELGDGSLPPKGISPALISSIVKELQKTGKISSKASSEEDSSSDDFVHSLWGTFVFSIIGIAAVVVVLALVLHFICHNEKPRAKPSKPSTHNNTPPTDFNEQPNPTFRNAAALSEETRTYPPPLTGSYENHAMSMDYDYDDDNRMSPVSHYPEQQYQHQTSLTNYNYQSSSFSPGMGQDYAGQQLENPQVSQSNFTFAPSPTFETEGHQVPPPDYESQVRTPGPSSPPISPFVPINPIYSQSKSVEESEYNYNYNQSNSSEYYREKVDEPFKYLDNYTPYSAKPENNDKANLTELSTKRAVLRNSTPYKLIEERVQGEDYDDTDTFVAPTPTKTELIKPPVHQKPQLSSDSFNDGKSKLVRVLPRFHHVPSQQNPNQLQQMGAGSSAVFKSVAPAPPPPPPDYIQQPIYAVSQKQF